MGPCIFMPTSPVGMPFARPGPKGNLGREWEIKTNGGKQGK